MCCQSNTHRHRRLLPRFSPLWPHQLPQFGVQRREMRVPRPPEPPSRGRRIGPPVLGRILPPEVPRILDIRRFHPRARGDAARGDGSARPREEEFPRGGVVRRVVVPLVPHAGDYHRAGEPRCQPAQVAGLVREVRGGAEHGGVAVLVHQKEAVLPPRGCERKVGKEGKEGHVRVPGGRAPPLHQLGDVRAAGVQGGVELPRGGEHRPGKHLREEDHRVDVGRHGARAVVEVEPERRGPEALLPRVVANHPHASRGVEQQIGGDLEGERRVGVQKGEELGPGAREDVGVGGNPLRAQPAAHAVQAGRVSHLLDVPAGRRERAQRGCVTVDQQDLPARLVRPEEVRRGGQRVQQRQRSGVQRHDEVDAREARRRVVPRKQLADALAGRGSEEVAVRVVRRRRPPRLRPQNPRPPRVEEDKSSGEQCRGTQRRRPVQAGHDAQHFAPAVPPRLTPTSP
ncbi:hypothetical protein DFJ74DRAFT_692315 [Hyaloraphidium curvatum]|nr:hypothetical protein DFJ74DRAFT_692315 [Hyaloraphidium curvatum]